MFTFPQTLFPVFYEFLRHCARNIGITWCPGVPGNVWFRAPPPNSPIFPTAAEYSKSRTNSRVFRCSPRAHTHTHTRDTPPRVACTGRFTLSDIVFRLAFGLTSERKVMKVCQSSFENVPPRKPLPPRFSFSTRSRGNFSTINDRSLPRNFLTHPSPCSPSLKTRMRKMGIIERERVWDRETRLLFC